MADHLGDTAPAGPPPGGVNIGVDGFDNLSEVGRGGFSIVYRAHQVEFGRWVALKLITSSLDDRAQARFERERRTIGALTGHPNIVTVFSAGINAYGLPYIVMEYLTGGSLADRLPDAPFAWRDATELMIKVTNAVQAAHEIGVLHRDIKPENVFLSAHGEPKLGDFGIARLEGMAATSTGVVTASVAHAAPEIIDGGQPTVVADVYALGSTLFALINGWPAHVRPTDPSLVPVLARIVSQPIPDLRPDGVPDALCNVLERAMAKDPADRIATAAELEESLRSALADPPSAEPTPVSPVAAATAVLPPPLPAQPAVWQQPAPMVPPPEAYPPQPQPQPQPTPSSRRAWYISGAIVALAAVLVTVGVVVALGRSSGTSTAPAAAPSPTTAGSRAPVRPPGTVRSTEKSPLPPGSPTPLFRPPGSEEYVVVSETGIVSSTDGKVFTPRLTNKALSGVSAGPQGWVAVGGGGIFVSEDAIAWQNVSDQSFTAIATDGVRWVAVGPSGAIAVSDDGREFTRGGIGEVGAAVEPVHLTAVASNGNGWVAVGEKGFILTSPDGVNWSFSLSGIQHADDLNAVATDGKTWTAVGTNGNIRSSTNGDSWSTGSAGGAGTHFRAVASGDEAWLAGGTKVFISDDGSTFTERSERPVKPIRSMVWNGQAYVALEEEGRISTFTRDGAMSGVIGDAKTGTPTENLSMAVAKPA